MNAEDVKKRVAKRYAEAARKVSHAQAAGPGCCSPSDDTGCGTAPTPDASRRDPVTADLYRAHETEGLPASAIVASLGCGNPTALAELRPGETVLDLGSGGGIDVLLSARRVGPAGRAYGLDMTDEMLELARRNQRQSGLANVEFLKGDIEAIPLPDESVDVVISNCVINLSVDKPKVLAEAFRVLRPGGRFAVSDIVLRGELPAEIAHSLELWAGCVAGALQETAYRRLLAAAGFEEIEVEPTRVYTVEDSRDFLSELGITAAAAAAAEGRIMSAFVRARKPG